MYGRDSGADLENQTETQGESNRFFLWVSQIFADKQRNDQESWVPAKTLEERML